MAVGLRGVIKGASYQLFRYGGLNWFSRNFLHSNSLLVLVYHGVVTEDHSSEPFLYRNTVSAREFDEQLRLLKRLFSPISASDLLAYFEQQRPLPPRPVLITFDDGYRNNLTQAAPVLKRYGVPALFHLATSYINSQAILWPDEVNLRVLGWQRPRIPLPASVGDAEVPSTDRVELAHHIRALCKQLPEEGRVAYLDQLRQEPCPLLERTDPDLFAFLSWPEACSLAALGFEIGSHTVSHPILTKITPPALEWELRESRMEIERRLGQPCPYIAYPNGQHTDYSPAVVDRVQQYYRLGFAATNSYAPLSGDRFTLSRINVPGHQPISVFESRISGLYAILSKVM